MHKQKYIKNNKAYKSSVNPKSYKLNVTNWVNRAFLFCAQNKKYQNNKEKHKNKKFVLKNKIANKNLHIKTKRK